MAAIPQALGEDWRRALALQKAGRLVEAIAVYRRLLSRTPRAAQLHTLLAGVLLETGELADAERHYRAALAASGVEPTIYLLTAYADFLLSRGRPADVIDLLASAPAADTLLLRLALAETRAGLGAQEHIATLRYRLELALRGDDRAHAREAAFFSLYLDDDAPRALSLALDNWTVQREPIDARLVLEAAAAANSGSAAQPVRDWLERHGAGELPISGE